MARRRWLLGVGLAVCGGLVGYGLATMVGGSASDGSPQASYPLLAKRLFVEDPNESRINFSPLRVGLNNYFKAHGVQGTVYFEYLPTGTSVRVNPDARYRAASLIKLPVAMEVYKAQERGLLSLDNKVTLKQEWLNGSFGTLYQKGAGYELTLRETVSVMLRESDNTALRVLIDATEDLKLEDRALGALDIELTSYQDGSIDIGTRSYSSFLKCLYFACYNTADDSQEILRLLTETPFDNRLAAGIGDKNVQVAHKIGVFNDKVQSDCGIVYLDSRHYALCIMLVGNDDELTNRRIADLSRMVYDFVKQ